MKVAAAVSGGPDSMAMLDQLVCKGIRPVVCHVNYHKRPTADRDERIVREYCEKKGLVFEKLDAQDPKGNFQAWARTVRYDFFEQTARKYGLEAVYVAHQQDDVLETYWMQKQKQAIPDVYGLAETVKLGQTQYRRILLDRTKEELEDYCRIHGISFGIDESNLTDGYARNRIRHHITGAMSPGQRQDLLQQMAEDNRNLLKKREDIRRFLSVFPPVCLLEQPEAWRYLEEYLFEKTGKHYGRRFMENAVMQLQKNVLIEHDGWMLERYGEALYFCSQKPEPLKIQNRNQLLERMNTVVGEGEETYVFKTSGTKAESVYIREEDFPLLIEPACQGERIAMRFGTKNIGRVYIDGKVPRIWRKIRPIVKNYKGEVLFVPGLGCDRNHFSDNPTFFMVKLNLSNFDH